jgi:hypothetical protein
MPPRKGKRRDAGRATGPRQCAAGQARVRSARYPGVGLEQCVGLCRVLADKRVDGLPAAAIAAALGHHNVRTNSFSAALSAARQFGLLLLRDQGYGLTALARSILEEAQAAQRQARYQQALGQPPLYAALIERLAGRALPEATALAGVVQRAYPVSPAASGVAAEMFLASARFAGAVGADGVLRLGVSTEPLARPAMADVTLELPLWGADQGKVIQLRAPAAITAESFERLLQAVRLHVRVEEPTATAARRGGT